MKLKRIRVYDSLHHSGRAYLEASREYLRAEALSLRRSDIDASEFELFDVDTENDPKQNNSCDCGVYTLVTSAQVALGAPVAVGPHDINNARDQIELALDNFAQHLELD